MDVNPLYIFIMKIAIPKTANDSIILNDDLTILLVFERDVIESFLII